MRSTFGGFELAKRAIKANQLGTETTANNVANADNPGYTRRTVAMQEAFPTTIPLGSSRTAQVGLGVQATEILRIRSAAVDASLRRDAASLGKSDAQLAGMKRVEAIILEPSDVGLQSALSEFWSTWDDIADRPDDAGLRAAVIGQGQTVGILVGSLAAEMDIIMQDSYSMVSSDVEKLNDMFGRVADLNKQIMRTKPGDTSRLDLLDRRDVLLDELATFIDVDIEANSDGSVSITAGGRWIVDRDHNITAKVARDADGQPVFELPEGVPFVPSGGRLDGHVSFMRSLYDYRKRLSDFASNLRDGVNSIHVLGHVGKGQLPLADAPVSNEPFFELPGPDDDPALSLKVRVTDPWMVAADLVEGAPPVIRFGETAARISALREDTDLAGKYEDMVVSIGRDTESATYMSEMNAIVIEQQHNLRDELTGVSVDEEMIDLVKYEAGYNAAAKLVTVMDEMLQTILGLVR